MEMNQTPASERIHIGLFGRRNAGKSSLMNAITNQKLAVVSEQKGTTTDPVHKTMELLPLGPVVMIDTPGLDDVGELGKLRMEKGYQVLRKTDIALLVLDASIGMQTEDKKLLEEIKKRGTAYLVVLNKSDLCEALNLPKIAEMLDVSEDKLITVSAGKKLGITKLREKIAECLPNRLSKRTLLADLVKPLDFVVLVVPIDSAAPKGRLILPQQQVIRALLEAGAVSIVVKEKELEETLCKLEKKPALVITDSQAFAFVSKIVPEDILLTSFSMLFARYKGDFAQAVKGVRALDDLKDNDMVLIAEGCTHHTQCEDIGTVKIPHWLAEYTGKNIQLEFTHGTEFPQDLSQYKLIIHCGGCMLNETEMQFRLSQAAEQKVPMTNYGIFISKVTGILERSTRVFKEQQECQDDIACQES